MDKDTQENAKEIGKSLLTSPAGLGLVTGGVIEAATLIGRMGPNGILLAGSCAVVAGMFGKDIANGAKSLVGITTAQEAPASADENENVDQHKRTLLDRALGRNYAQPKDASDEDEDFDSAPARKPDDAKGIVRYADIMHRIPSGKALLGVNPVTGRLALTDWEKFKCLWVVGSSSTGKSNTVYGKAMEAVNAGAKLLVIDQHANKPDSLSRKLQPFKSSFLLPVAVEDHEVISVLDLFRDEFERRVKGGRYTQKIVLICDEMNRMVRNAALNKALQDIVAICGEESRGFGMYGWFISQKAVHLKWLRDSAITVIAHRVTRFEEAKLACNDDRKAANRLLTYPVGRTYIYGVDFNEPMELQQALYDMPDLDDDEDENDFEAEEGDDEGVIPLQKLDIAKITNWFESGKIDANQMVELLKTVSNPAQLLKRSETTRNAQETHSQAAPPDTRNVSETLLETAETGLETQEKEPFLVSDETLGHIKRMKEMGVLADRDICKCVGLSGGKYKQYQMALAKLGYTK